MNDNTSAYFLHLIMSCNDDRVLRVVNIYCLKIKCVSRIILRHSSSLIEKKTNFFKIYNTYINNNTWLYEDYRKIVIIYPIKSSIFVSNITAIILLPHKNLVGTLENNNNNNYYYFRGQRVFPDEMWLLSRNNCALLANSLGITAKSNRPVAIYLSLASPCNGAWSRSSISEIEMCACAKKWPPCSRFVLNDDIIFSRVN